MIRAAAMLRWVSCGCAVAALAVSIRTAAQLRERGDRSPSPTVPKESPQGDPREAERLRAESQELLERVRALPLQGPSGEESLTTGQLKAAVEEALDRRELEALRRRLAEGFPGVQKENRAVMDEWKAAAGPGPEQAERWKATLESLDAASRMAVEEAISIPDYRRRLLEARAEAERAVDSWLTPEQRERKGRLGVSGVPR